MATIRPQPGPQTAFLKSPADIVIFGGGAFGGKSFGLLLEAARHVGTDRYRGVIFRRTMPEIDNPGGLWDESNALYPTVGGWPKSSRHEWMWPRYRSRIKLAHLQYDKDLLSWHGSQVPFFGFDELTTFTRRQFFYLLSRNRNPHPNGIKPYIRATTNPDADSWVAELIAWWIDPVTGFPIPARDGVVRWFVNLNDTLIWADDPRELLKHLPDPSTLPEGVAPPQPKSLTFIRSSIYDNPAGLKADPGYLGNLLALGEVDKQRLLGGNWKIRPAAGLYFQRSWLTTIDVLPAGIKLARGWDLAATEKTEKNDPDWTAGHKLGFHEGRYIMVDHVRDRKSPHGVETLMKNTASSDGRSVAIGLPQDPGAAGKAQAEHLVKVLDGYAVSFSPETGDKLTRFKAFSSQAEGGNVDVLRGPWNDTLFTALEAFPMGAHDDDVDAVSRAYLTLQEPGNGLLDYWARLAAEQAKPPPAMVSGQHSDPTRSFFHPEPE